MVCITDPPEVRCDLSVTVATQKLVNFQLAPWAHPQSRGFLARLVGQKKPATLRKLAYLPGMDCDMLEGQLRENELLLCWYYPGGNRGISTLRHVVPASFEECLERSEMDPIVGFFAASPAVCGQVKKLR